MVMLMNTLEYLVIIGDIIKSRDIANRQDLQFKFKSAMSTIESFNATKIVSPFTVTIGDEFQGVVKTSKGLFNFFNTLADNLNYTNFRYGIGIGNINTLINPKSAIGMDGSAFHNARESLEKAKSKGLKYCFKSNSPKDQVVNLLLSWKSDAEMKLSLQKRKLLFLKKKKFTQKQIAQFLQISQPAVSKALPKTTLKLLQETEVILENEIETILNSYEPSYNMVAEEEAPYNRGK